MTNEVSGLLDLDKFQLQFNSNNWNVAQTVSAIGLDDFVDDDDPFAGWVFVSNNFVVNPAYASAEAQPSQSIQSITTRWE